MTIVISLGKKRKKKDKLPNYCRNAALGTNPAQLDSSRYFRNKQFLKLSLLNFCLTATDRI